MCKGGDVYKCKTVNTNWLLSRLHTRAPQAFLHFPNRDGSIQLHMHNPAYIHSYITQTLPPHLTRSCLKQYIRQYIPQTMYHNCYDSSKLTHACKQLQGWPALYPANTFAYAVHAHWRRKITQVTCERKGICENQKQEHPVSSVETLSPFQ